MAVLIHAQASRAMLQLTIRECVAFIAEQSI